jgi:hypothetical protein
MEEGRRSDRRQITNEDEEENDKIEEEIQQLKKSLGELLLQQEKALTIWKMKKLSKFWRRGLLPPERSWH